MKVEMKDMKASTLNANGLYEYLLIAAPAKEVYNKVLAEKKKFNDNYKTGFDGKPNITVSNFIARDEMENTLIRWMQRVVGELKSFDVTLNNYSGFPPHTVFLRIQDHLPFKQLVKGLRVIESYIDVNDCPPAWFISSPHVSIAAELSSAIYEQAMREYAQKMFHASFMVSELVLLRRQHIHDPCKQIAVFRLQPEEVYYHN